MKTTRLLLTLLLPLLFSPAAFGQDCFGNSCLPKEATNSCTESKSNGCIDWENGVIYAVGMGVPNPNFPSAAQRSYSAYQAAKVVAMRNLLQMVEETHITSNQTVKMGMLENDVITTQINGKLRQVQEVGQPRSMSDGSMWVSMKMHMRDIMTILINNQQLKIGDGRPFGGDSSNAPQSQPYGSGGSTYSPSNHMGTNQAAQTAPEPVEASPYGGSADQIYGGLIIDASGISLTPAMSPKVFDENGKEVYGSAAVDRNFAIQHGIIGYVKGLEKAKGNERIQGKPLLIKAIRRSSNSSDVIISNQDAELLRKMEVQQTFLREARVILVLG